MSATQSKEKIRNGKSSTYYGRRRGGYRSCCGSELTRDESVTLQRLKAFTPRARRGVSPAAVRDRAERPAAQQSLAYRLRVPGRVGRGVVPGPPAPDAPEKPARHARHPEPGQRISVLARAYLDKSRSHRAVRSEHRTV